MVGMTCCWAFFRKSMCWLFVKTVISNFDNSTVFNFRSNFMTHCKTSWRTAKTSKTPPGVPLPCKVLHPIGVARIIAIGLLVELGIAAMQENLIGVYTLPSWKLNNYRIISFHYFQKGSVVISIYTPKKLFSVSLVKSQHLKNYLLREGHIVMSWECLGACLKNMT